MTGATYLDINVYDAALERVRFVYEHCDDVIVSMSGGKDSTVILYLARIVTAAAVERLDVILPVAGTGTARESVEGQGCSR